MRAAVRIRDGLWWVACNTDLTIPTAFGLAPGHGVLVETVRRFSGVEPVVAGKPARPLLDETVRRCGGERPLMVGDRLDTDIDGAQVAGVDSLLVMTGVTGLPELVAAGPEERPTYSRARPGRSGRGASGPEVRERARSHLGGWTARVAPTAGCRSTAAASADGLVACGRGGGLAPPRRHGGAREHRRRRAVRSSLGHDG